MASESQAGRVQICRRASEAVMLSLACLAPWAFGAVEAWAELAIEIGIALIAVFGFIAGRGAARAESRPDLPSLALAGLGLLALFQAAPLSQGLLARVSPATASLRAELVPQSPERVLGDDGPAVPLPAATIGQDPEAALRMAMRLAAVWLLFQGVFGLEPGYGPLRRFGTATAVNATLMALFSLVQMLTWNGKIYWLRLSPESGSSAGPFVSHNHLAAYLNLGLGFAVASVLMPDRSGRAAASIHSRLWSGYATGILVIGILATLSRNGFLSMTVALGVTIVVLRPRVWQLVAGVAAVGMLVLVFLAVLGSTVAYQERLATLMGAHPWQFRMGIWRDALGAWPAYPIWGTGLGSFPVVMARRLGSSLGGVGDVAVHAENEYVEWLVEGGLVGFGLVLLGIGGVVVLARRALIAATSPSQRALVLGASFGGVAILVESLADFALHIPGVTVTVVILAAHLTKLGLEARAREASGGEQPPAERDAGAYLSALTKPVLGVFLVIQGIGLARSEAAYRAAARPWPGQGAPVTAETVPEVGRTDAIEKLERQRAAIERSLALRPNWAEGYQELGFVLLELYQEETARSLREAKAEPAQAALLSSHYWLHLRVHAPPEENPPTPQELLDMPPVRADLIPAARAFLQARRCCPYLPFPHAELAALDGVLRGAEPPGVMIARALRLAGANSAIFFITERLAIQVGDLNLLSRILRRALISTPLDWPRVAESARNSLPADQILSEVVPNGRFAILFADHLYGAPKDSAVRERFLREGLKRLPGDRGLSPADRLHLEARAWYGLDDRKKARSQMELALAAAPGERAWRKELVQWFIKWGQFKDAHDQAVTAVAIAPGPESQEALELAVEAMARGSHTPAKD